MVALSARLEAHLAQNWRQDLTPVWRAFFAGAEPNLAQLPVREVPEVFPARLDIALPRADADQVPNFHMTRAFDYLTPDRVRVVIIGQDPYPRRCRATGRAFEDGSWNAGNLPAPATSLRRLLQSAAATEHPGLEISQEIEDWPSVRQAIQNRLLTAPTFPAFFNSLAVQGVLSVNAAWTFTGKEKQQLNAHIAVWKPVMHHLLLELVRKEGREPIVFLLLGRKAQERFQAATRRYFRENEAPNVKTVYCAHPTAMPWLGPAYYGYENPFTQVNRALEELETDAIRWWPERADAVEPD